MPEITCEKQGGGAEQAGWVLKDDWEFVRLTRWEGTLWKAESSVYTNAGA